MTRSVDEKRRDAEERQAEYDKLTLDQKLARAKKRGHAGTKEVKKLQAQIDARREEQNKPKDKKRKN